MMNIGVTGVARVRHFSGTRCSTPGVQYRSSASPTTLRSADWLFAKSRAMRSHSFLLGSSAWPCSLLTLLFRSENHRMPDGEAKIDFVQSHQRSSCMSAVANRAMPLTRYPPEEVALGWRSSHTGNMCGKVFGAVA